MRIVVHGQQAFGKSVLEALLERGETVVGVYCGPDPAQGGRVDPLKEAALARNLPVFQPRSFRNKPEVWEEFARLKADLCVMAYVTLIVPEAVLTSGTPLFAPDARPKIYIVMNGKLTPEFEIVEPATVPIVTRSFETSVRANTRNTLIAAYQFAKRKNWEVNLAAIDAHYPTSKTYGFNTAYMQQLFEHGYQKGTSGQIWRSQPLD